MNQLEKIKDMFSIKSFYGHEPDNLNLISRPLASNIYTTDQVCSYKPLFRFKDGATIQIQLVT